MSLLRTWKTHAAKGEQALKSGRYQKALDRLRRARRGIEKSRARESLDHARILNDLGAASYYLGDLGAADDFHQSALLIREAICGESHPLVALSLDNLAAVWCDVGRVDDARRAREKACTILVSEFGESHVDTAVSLSNLAETNRRAGNLDSAKSGFQSAIEILEGLDERRTAAYATCLNNLAAVHFENDEFEAAAPLAREALAIRSELLPADHPDVAQSQDNLSAVRAKLESA